MPMWENGDPRGPMENGTTYIVRPRIAPSNSPVIVARISSGSRQLLVGPASISASLQMNVRSSTRATSAGSERARKLFGRWASDSRLKVPLATSSSQRRSYSSWLPSHQWTASGWKSRRPFSTKSNRAWFVVAAVISKFFPTRGPRSRTGAGGSGQSFQLGLGADGDEDLTGAQQGLRRRVGGEPAAGVPQGQDQGAGRVADVGVPQRPAGQRGARRQRHLLQPELQAPVMHHHVEELGHMGLEHEGGHAGAADALGVDHPVGAGLGQLGLRALDPGPGDDEQVGAQRPGGEGHEQVGGVGV